MKYVERGKRENQVTFKGRSIRTTPDFLIQPLKARGAWNYVSYAMEDKSHQLRLLYPENLAAIVSSMRQIN